MNEIVGQNEFRAVVQQATSAAIANGRSINDLRGIALWDLERAAPLRSLSSFGSATLAVARIPNFVIRFGADAATRVVLQFVYEYFKRIDDLRYHEGVE